MSQDKEEPKAPTRKEFIDMIGAIEADLSKEQKPITKKQFIDIWAKVQADEKRMLNQRANHMINYRKNQKVRCISHSGMPEFWAYRTPAIGQVVRLHRKVKTNPPDPNNEVWEIKGYLSDRLCFNMRDFEPVNPKP